MEEGVEGGVVGGVPGGVLGGVLGGTGTGPVMDYDSAPRPIKITRPQYPQEAFVKKIEGTVVVEILIDSQGRVVRARVIQSVPLLDAAALQTVYQWVFQPAVKHTAARCPPSPTPPSPSGSTDVPAGASLVVRTRLRSPATLAGVDPERQRGETRRPRLDEGAW